MRASEQGKRVAGTDRSSYRCGTADLTHQNGILEGTVIALPAIHFQPRRYRPGNLGTWSGHLQFASDLIREARPSVLVELGAHYGESYFGFCQAIAEAGVSCECYAVDTWRGDAHAGWYGEEVFEEVDAYNATHYKSFSHLLRSTFDDANEHFPDAGIDLLHIDGLHTYEQVRHDFNTWLPKVRSGGIILLHDTSARHADFGVWRLWNEIRSEYQSFEFYHSWGLGVLRVGTARYTSDFLRALFEGTSDDRAFLRHYYALQAERLEFTAAGSRCLTSPSYWAQVYTDQDGGYTEQHSVKAELSPGVWNHISFALSSGAGPRPIRFDPANCAAIIDIAEVRVRSAPDIPPIACWSGRDLATVVKCGSQIQCLSSSSRTDPVRFLSLGPDPQLFLPRFPVTETEPSIVIEVELRMDMDISAAFTPSPYAPTDTAADAASPQSDIVEEEPATRNLVSSQTGEHETLLRDIASVREELTRSQGDVGALVTERDQLMLDVASTRDAVRALQQSLAAANDQRQLLETELDRCNSRHNVVQAELRLSQTQVLVATAECRRLSSQHQNLETQIEVGRLRLQREEDLRIGLERDVCRLTSELHVVQKQCERLSNVEEDYERLRSIVEKERATAEDLRLVAADERRQKEDLLNSYSWRLMAPLRVIGRLVLGRRT